ncbi:unnamed protein product [Parnassius mnemosyne]|uniref:DUF4817 domain-containing protein n=1 Tax=Parnassius mnemosyne TaxID=213953 RepID=A0AAV1LUE1_9NEOP
MPSTIDSLSAREVADIHYIYGFCDGNARAASREYHQRFPTRPAVDYRVFLAVHRELSENGLHRPHRERASTVPVDVDEQVLRLVYQDPTISTRRIALQLGINHVQIVYSTPISTREELLQKVMAAASQIKENRTVLKKTVRSVALRSTVCMDENGGHFENLIN